MAEDGEPDDGRASHAIVLGCGRSGTSIFGELFAGLPGYSYRSEPPFEALAGYHYGTPVAIKAPKPAPGRDISPGLPFLVDELCAAVPEPRRIFWMVRHPLDAICSLRVGISKNGATTRGRRIGSRGSRNRCSGVARTTGSTSTASATSRSGIGPGCTVSRT